MFNRGPVSRGIAQHPFIIKKIEELPEPLLRLAHNYSHLFDSIDFMLVIPNQSFLKGLFGRRFAPQQALLFNPDGILHLQDAPAPDLPGQAVLIEAKNLRCLVSSLLLLYGKLEIFAEQGGLSQKIEVEYNTVAHDLMKPYLQRFLRASWQTRSASYRMDCCVSSCLRSISCPTNSNRGCASMPSNHRKSCVASSSSQRSENLTWAFFAARSRPTPCSH
jgi:hypothetical protein